MQQSIVKYLLVVLLALVACSDDDSSSIINDQDGVEISLTWTTPTGTATVNADLDLLMTDNLYANEASTSRNSFESLVLDNDLDSREYTIKVKLYSNATRADYTVKVKSVSGSKSIETKGFFEANEADGTTIEVIKILKDRAKYKVTVL